VVFEYDIYIHMYIYRHVHTHEHIYIYIHTNACSSVLQRVAVCSTFQKQQLFEIGNSTVGLAVEVISVIKCACHICK